MSVDTMERDDANDLALFSQDEAARVINRLYAEAHAHAETAVTKAIQCGMRLADQKASLGHGAWLPWVEKHLTFGESMARKHMQLARNQERVTDIGPTSLREAVKLLSEPREDPEPTVEKESSGDALLKEMKQLYLQQEESLDKKFVAFEKKQLDDRRELERKLATANTELERLRKLETDKATVETALKDIHELEKKKLDLFKDAESTKLVQQVLVRSREFFTRECMQIPALKLRPESVKVMKQDFEGLVELVENWLSAVKERFL